MLAVIAVSADEDYNTLLETQNFLRSPERMQSEAASNPKAADADRVATITTLGKPELKQDLMNISADLMGWIVQSSNGDTAKMEQMLSEAMANPRVFLDKMPSSEREKIRALSGKIEAGRPAPKKSP